MSVGDVFDSPLQGIVRPSCPPFLYVTTVVLHEPARLPDGREQMNEGVSEVLAEEQVVLLDERFRPVGAAPKGSVHNSSTELHPAFSCYVFDSAGRVLVTRRALTKRTWPGVWTKSFCGHPGPREHPERAVVRRARQELGMAVRDLRLALTDFPLPRHRRQRSRRERVLPGVDR
jgi:hypothetical protein